MKTVSRIISGAFAATAALASAAVAGSNYESGPTVGDNAAVAGLVLLLAIGAVLLLKKDGVVPPVDDDKDDAADEE